jgi:MFS family permease
MKGEAGKAESHKKLGRTVKVLGLVSFFTDTSMEMVYPLLPIFFTSVLGAGPVFLGIIEGIAEGSSSVLKGFSGYISDRIRKRKAIIVAGYSLSAISDPLFAASRALWQALVVRFAERIGKGVRESPRDAMIADATDASIRGKAYGFHRGMDTLGAVVGPALAFLFMSLFQNKGNTAYRLVFLIAFVPGLIAVLLLIFLIRERSFGAGRQFPRFRLSLFSENFKYFVLIILIFNLGNSSDAFLLLRAHDVGISVTFVPLLWLVFNVVYAAISMPSGSLSDHVGRKRILVFGFFLYALVYLGFGLSNSVAWTWLLFGVYGVFYGLTQGVFAAFVADLAPADLKGTAFGIYQTAEGSGRLIASLVFGALWQFVSPAVAFGFGAALAVVAAFMMLVFCSECGPASGVEGA